MELFDVMRTTFSAREFTDDPLPDSTLFKIFENARFAPNGGNRQGWKVIVQRDPEVREKLVELMVPYAKRYTAQAMAGENPFNTVDPTALTQEQIDNTKPVARLLDATRDAPVLLMICVDLKVLASMDAELDRVGMTSGASIYPFVWNILLAARHEGYGGVLTTFLTAEEPAVQKLLDLPEHIAVAAAVPLGKPVKQLTKLKREPVESFAMLERWDGEILSG